MAEIRYDGKVAIVTGAGGGLGRTHALLLGARGAKVLVNDLGGSAFGDGADQTPAAKVCAEIKALGGVAAPNYDSVVEGEKIVKAALDAFGRIDIVVNNAGILRDVSFHKMTDDDWAKIFAVHVQGSYSVTKAAWSILRDQNYGRIIMTTSAAGLYGNFGQANYSAAKMAIAGLGLTLAIEGQKRNVMVNIIAPIAGSRLTETVMPKEICDQLKPEFVSPLVGYLVSEDCKTTGGIYEVGAGTFSRVRWFRNQGVAIPIKDGVTVEKVAANWEKINDMSNGQFCDSLQMSSVITMQNLASQQ